MNLWRQTNLTLAALVACIILLFNSILPVFALENNVNINGTLVQEPCTLDPETAEIPLDFGNVVSKYFLINKRTPGLSFVIRLKDCDLSIGKKATVIFVGQESKAQPGLLLPDDGDVHGFAFGIETDDEKPEAIPVNTPSQIFELDNSQPDTELHLRGYISANINSEEEQPIKTGPFTGSATFEIVYP